MNSASSLSGTIGKFNPNQINLSLLHDGSHVSDKMKNLLVQLSMITFKQCPILTLISRLEKNTPEGIQNVFFTSKQLSFKYHTNKLIVSLLTNVPCIHKESESFTFISFISHTGIRMGCSGKNNGTCKSPHTHKIKSMDVNCILNGILEDLKILISDTPHSVMSPLLVNRTASSSFFSSQSSQDTCSTTSSPIYIAEDSQEMGMVFCFMRYTYYVFFNNLLIFFINNQNSR